MNRRISFKPLPLRSTSTFHSRAIEKDRHTSTLERKAARNSIQTDREQKAPEYRELVDEATQMTDDPDEWLHVVPLTSKPTGFCSVTNTRESQLQPLLLRMYHYKLQWSNYAQSLIHLLVHRIFFSGQPKCSKNQRHQRTILGVNQKSSLPHKNSSAKLKLRSITSITCWTLLLSMRSARQEGSQDLLARLRSEMQRDENLFRSIQQVDRLEESQDTQKNQSFRV